MQNNYYVYLHKTLDDKVFYVGKGSGNRAYSKTSRGKSWLDFTNKNEYKVEIIQEGMTNREALDVETNLIASLEGLVNKQLKFEYVTLRKEDLERKYSYSEKSPSGLIRHSKTYNGIGFVGKLGNAGHVCTINNKDYWKVKHCEKSVLVHRIVWALYHGETPENLVIDHIDGNGLNNKIENLRCVTQKENCSNRKQNKGKDLPKNVTFEDGKWPRFRVKKGSQMKSFHIKNYKDKQEALQAAVDYLSTLV